MGRQGVAYANVKLTEDEHRRIKILAATNGVSMRLLFTQALEHVVRLRWAGVPVAYEPNYRSTKTVILTVEPMWAASAKEQAVKDNIGYGTFYTAAAKVILSEEIGVEWNETAVNM